MYWSLPFAAFTVGRGSRFTTPFTAISNPARRAQRGRLVKAGRQCGQDMKQDMGMDAVSLAVAPVLQGPQECRLMAFPFDPLPRRFEKGFTAGAARSCAGQVDRPVKVDVERVGRGPQRDGMAERGPIVSSWPNVR